jgi:hypothetical protein
MLITSFTATVLPPPKVGLDSAALAVIQPLLVDLVKEVTFEVLLVTPVAVYAPVGAAGFSWGSV